jgi:YjbR
MKIASVRSFALSLSEVTEEPHHHFSSFRVAGKIFVTVPPDQEHIHVFVPETAREQALATYPEFMEKLLWGGKVVGIRISLPSANAKVVKAIVKAAWSFKAPAVLAAEARRTPLQTRRRSGEA